MDSGEFDRLKAACLVKWGAPDLPTAILLGLTMYGGEEFDDESSAAAFLHMSVAQMEELIDIAIEQGYRIVEVPEVARDPELPNMAGIRALIEEGKGPGTYLGMRVDQPFDPVYREHTIGKLTLQIGPTTTIKDLIEQVRGKPWAHEATLALTHFCTGCGWIGLPASDSSGHGVRCPNCLDTQLIDVWEEQEVVEAALAIGEVAGIAEGWTGATLTTLDESAEMGPATFERMAAALRSRDDAASAYERGDEGVYDTGDAGAGADHQPGRKSPDAL